MFRNIVAVIAGYLVAGITIFAVFTGAYALLGTEGSFQPGSYEIKPLWTVMAIVVGVLAAMLGGYVCKAIARNSRAVFSLALLMVILGAVTAFGELKGGAGKDPGSRPPGLSGTEAMKNARQPPWMLFLNPLLGFAGALIGGRLKKTPS